jgi:hypothetical protein
MIWGCLQNDFLVQCPECGIGSKWGRYVFSVNLTLSLGSIKWHVAVRRMVAGQWECLRQNTTYVRKVPRLHVLQTNQKHPAISVPKCKSRSSTKVYCQRSSDSFQRRRPDMWAKGTWFILHDNPRSHTVMSVKEFLSALQITVLSRVSYFPVSV